MSESSIIKQIAYSELEHKRYAKIYLQITQSQDRLDRVAVFMGWMDEHPGTNDEYISLSHPLGIASRALFGRLVEMARSATNSFDLVCSIFETRSNIDHAISALECGLNTEATVFFKRSLSGLNEVMTHSPNKDFMDICFDIREVAIRVAEDCRNGTRY
tara:strand:+ start:925 stop:1401 length:477 start_codon:yes stop_codon:yes gene_type:complete